MNRLTTKIMAGVMASAMLIAVAFHYDALSGSGASTQKAADVVQPVKRSIPQPSSSAASSAVPLPDPVVLTEHPDASVVKNPAALKNSIVSPNAILVCVDDSTILLDKNAGKRIYPASMTKIMTALLVAEESPDLSEKVTVQQSVIDKMNSLDASQAGFLPGEQVSERDLLYGAVLPSGAECCISLADRLQGSEQNFAAAMNRKAAFLGMTGTHFTDTTGLQDPNHYTTAKDLATLLCYALQNQTFRRVFTTPTYTSAPTNKHPQGLSMQSTMFHSLESSKAGKATILGGKVGYTDEAGLCLASLAEFGGKEYVLVTAGAKDVYRAEIKDALTVYGSLGR